MVLRFRFRAAACCLPLLLLVLTGCGGHAAAPPASGASPTSGQGAPTATRTIVDMAGRTVTIPAEVATVGTGYPAVNQILFMLGSADRLVANDKGAAETSPFFASIYPRLKDIPGLFTAGAPEVNIEELARIRPDVVFLTPSGEPLLEALANIDVSAVIISVFNDPEQLKAGVTLIADVMGGDAPARAQRFADYYDANVSRAAAATADIPQASKPTAYYTANGPLVTEGKGSIVTTWMDQAGGRNIAAENGISAPPTFATVTLEDVLAWNPDIIICRDPETKQEILQDARWRTIAAVRNDRVIVNPAGVFVWSVRSAESALQPLWAAQTFHPDRFPDLDIRQVVRDFYQKFYSYSLSDQQLDQIFNPPPSRR